MYCTYTRTRIQWNHSEAHRGKYIVKQELEATYFMLFYWSWLPGSVFPTRLRGLREQYGLKSPPPHQVLRSEFVSVKEHTNPQKRSFCISAEHNDVYLFSCNSCINRNYLEKILFKIISKIYLKAATL